MGANELYLRVSEYIRNNHMIENGDRVCVGCSGGADSMFLAAVLKRLRKEMPFELMVCHVNHGLRGEESDADQQFVESWCKENKVPFRLFSFNVRDISEKHRVGLEEAGRLARGQAFNTCVKENGVSKIALAHHMNDQAETVLFHLARGSGLSGIAGIRPVTWRFPAAGCLFPDKSCMEPGVNGEEVRCCCIRPLLCAERSEIEEALREWQIPWRTDSTNLLDDQTRNRIRHRILPEMEKCVHHGTVRHIAAMAELSGEADDYFRRKAADWLGRFGEEAAHASEVSDRMILLPGVLRQEEIIIRKYVVRESCERLVPGLRNLGIKHVDTVLSLFDSETGKQKDLPCGIHAVSEYGNVRLYHEKQNSIQDGVPGSSQLKEKCAKAVPIMQEKGTVSFSGWRFVWDVFPSENENLSELTREQKYTKYLNYDKIKSGLTIRTRQSGDGIVINRSGIRKSLKKYMIDEKIPAVFRDSVPVLASGGEIWWIVGGRISCAAEIDESTENVLKITADRIRE